MPPPSTQYPSQIDNLITLPSVIDGVTPVTGLVINRLRDTLFTIESTLGVNPASIYGTVKNRLDILEQTIAGEGGAGSAFIVGSAAVGQTIIWNGVNWVPGTDFINQNIKTVGEMVSGPALSTTSATGLNQLAGKLIFEGITPLRISDPGQGIIYFDIATSQFLVSQNGSPYFPINNANASAGGDLSGLYPNPKVVKINGASVPIAGTLNPGDLLFVDGYSSLKYGRLNLSDGYVVGVLPPANQSPQLLGGDLSGSTTTGFVIGLQGIPVAPGTPTIGSALLYNGSYWGSGLPLVTLIGDVTGLSSSNTVVNINGASVPVAGALTPGNVLQVSGASSLTYGPINLNGGSNVVSGILSVAHQESQVLGGQLSGTTSNAAVLALQGNPVAPGNVNSGQLLFGIGSNTWSPATVFGDVTSSSLFPGKFSVTGIQGFPVNGGTPNAGQFLVATSTGSWGSIYPSGDINFAFDGYYDGYRPIPGELTVVGIQGSSFSSIPPVQGYFVVATSTSSFAPITLSGDIIESSGFGSTPGQLTVEAIQGVNISGTPSSGQVLIASSSSAASWQTFATGTFSAGGDLSGTDTSQIVTGIRGHNVLATAPGFLQVLQFNGSSWAPTTLATSYPPNGAAGGDLTNTYPNPTVAKIQGNTVTSGALTKGQFFIASSTSNWAPTFITGDISASLTTSGALTVTGLQGRVVTSTLPTSGQVLAWNGSSWAPTTASSGGAASGDLSGTYPGPTVTGIQGIVVPTPSGTNTVLTYNTGSYTWSTSSTGITQLTNDVIAGPGSGSQSATVVAIQGNTIQSGILGALQDGYVLTWVNTSNEWIAEPLPGSFTPSGTGLVHIISGVEQSTATLIVNADVDPSAAIVYSKLNLTGNIVNNDISAVAGISYSKLNLGNSIVNVDVSPTAAIAYSKLNLTANIVNNDISSTAAIAGTKINPNFGSQVVQTTGDGYFADGYFSGILNAGATTVTSIKDTGLSTGVVHSNASGNFTSSAVNLASADVSGVLPTGNQANQTMGGDVSGPTGSATVVAIRTHTVRSETLTASQDGYVLTWDNGLSQWRALTPNSSGGTPGGVAGGDLGGLYPDPTVEFIQGNEINFGVLGSAQDGYVATWDNIDGYVKMAPTKVIEPTLAGDVTGLGSTNTISEIQGNAVNLGSLGSAQDGYVMTWDNADGQIRMEPGTSGSFSPGGDLTGNSSSQIVSEIQGNEVLLGTLGPSQDGYVITWNNTASKLEMEPVITPATTLNGDVIGLATSNVIAEIQGNVIDLGGLLGALQDGYVLAWNNTTAKLEMSPSPVVQLNGDVSGTSAVSYVGQRKSFLFMGG